jgi:hypothetical protein
MTTRTGGLAAFLVAGLVSAACSSTPSAPEPFSGQWTAAPDIATRAVLTCSSDGTTSLSTDTIQPRPDGIHLEVVNEYDEPVSVEGFDADPGVTDWVFPRGPGTMQLMCWPYSEHGSGETPTRTPLGIVDPLGLYLDGSLACNDEDFPTAIGSYGERPVDEGPPPLDIAREVIDGLREDDVLRVAGYPEQDGGAVIVIRDGGVAGRYGIGRSEGKPWTVTSGSACPDSGLPHEGKRYA